MALPTRRTLLQLATAAAAGLAGCGQFVGESTRSSHSSSSSDEVTLPDDRSAPNPPMVHLRSDSATPPIEFEANETRDIDASMRRGPTVRFSNELIDTSSKAEDVSVGDGFDRERVSSFVAETDFDSETLYLESKRVRECFELHLCGISWNTDRVRTHYVRSLRPYDEQCTVDAWVTESRLIRLPVALDADSVSSYGSSTSGSGSCDEARGVRTRDSSGESDETASSRGRSVLGGGER